MTANERQVGGAHYLGTRLQHWDWAVENSLGYLEGQVTKYVARWRRKNGAQDLEKALHYADKLLEVSDLRTFAGRPVQVYGLREIAAAYALTEREQLIFRLAAVYQNAEDLRRLRAEIAKLLEENGLQ